MRVHTSLLRSVSDVVVRCPIEAKRRRSSSLSPTVAERQTQGTANAGVPQDVTAPYIGVSAPSQWGTSVHNTLYWINPPDPLYNRTLVVRKIGSAPTSPDDGEIVHDSHVPAFVDRTGTADTHYYYRIYTVGHNGEYSEGVVDLITSPAITWRGFSCSGSGFVAATVHFPRTPN